MDTMAKAAADVLAERRRQIEVEGWTPEHDDTHSHGAMAVAAACYCLTYKRRALEIMTLKLETLWQWTGWASSWFKPKSQRDDLIRAGALILAEIERLDRAAEKPPIARPVPPAGTIRRECDAPPSPETKP